MNFTNWNNLQKINITKPNNVNFLKPIFIPFPGISTGVPWPKFSSLSSTSIYQHKRRLGKRLNFKNNKNVLALVSHEISSNLGWRHNSDYVPFMKQMHLCFKYHPLEHPGCCLCVWAAPLASSLLLPLFVWKICVVCISSGLSQVFLLIHHVLQEWTVN